MSDFEQIQKVFSKLEDFYLGGAMGRSGKPCAAFSQKEGCISIVVDLSIVLWKECEASPSDKVKEFKKVLSRSGVDAKLRRKSSTANTEEFTIRIMLSNTSAATKILENILEAGAEKKFYEYYYSSFANAEKEISGIICAPKNATAILEGAVRVAMAKKKHELLKIK